MISRDETQIIHLLYHELWEILMLIHHKSFFFSVSKGVLVGILALFAANKVFEICVFKKSGQSAACVEKPQNCAWPMIGC